MPRTLNSVFAECRNRLASSWSFIESVRSNGLIYNFLHHTMSQGLLTGAYFHHGFVHGPGRKESLLGRRQQLGRPRPCKHLRRKPTGFKLELTLLRRQRKFDGHGDSPEFDRSCLFPKPLWDRSRKISDAGARFLGLWRTRAESSSATTRLALTFGSLALLVIELIRNVRMVVHKLVAALGATEMPVISLCGIRTRSQGAVRAS
jgi:hypothetical protein